jgi:hypothetical protein
MKLQVQQDSHYHHPLLLMYRLHPRRLQIRRHHCPTDAPQVQLDDLKHVYGDLGQLDLEEDSKRIRRGVAVHLAGGETIVERLDVEGAKSSE